jgi:hypothetical protein
MVPEGGGKVAADAVVPAVRTVVPLMRVALLVGAFLVTLAGIQLYVLSGHTDRYFAWTIAVSLTAAFLGAFYWASAPLALLAGLRGVWVDARPGVLGVLVFLWATLLTTLIHLGKFHLHGPGHIAQGAAWLWLIIYAADPPLLSVALFLQVRAAGSDPPRSAPVDAWYRVALAIQAAVALGEGVILFAVPLQAARWWPWPLTPLTARAIASWLLGLGVMQATCFFENDWARIRLATISYSLLGVLQLAALARYSTTFRWGVAGGIYIAFVASILLLGLYGWARAATRSRATISPNTLPRDG